MLEAVPGVPAPTIVAAVDTLASHTNDWTPVIDVTPPTAGQQKRKRGGSSSSTDTAVAAAVAAAAAVQHRRRLLEAERFLLQYGREQLLLSSSNSSSKQQQLEQLQGLRGVMQAFKGLGAEDPVVKRFWRDYQVGFMRVVGVFRQHSCAPFSRALCVENCYSVPVQSHNYIMFYFASCHMAIQPICQLSFRVLLYQDLNNENLSSMLLLLLLCSPCAAAVSRVCGCLQFVKLAGQQSDIAMGQVALKTLISNASKPIKS